VNVNCNLNEEQLHEFRQRQGLDRATRSLPIKDVGIRGLDALLERLPHWTLDECARRAIILWEALCDLYGRRGKGIFEVQYEWGYLHESRSEAFDAEFVRLLNECRSIPNPSGVLLKLESIIFEKIGWKSNPFLESKIRFKLPLIEQLAKEAEFEPNVLDFLQSQGLTSLTALLKRLNPKDAPSPENTKSTDGSVEKHSHEPKAPFDGETGNIHGEMSTERNRRQQQLVSYIGIVPQEVNSDPDRLGHSKRMSLKTAAIDFILKHEEDWKCTPKNNPGFDLFRGDTAETASEWCEVKAMAGTLEDRPVGISRTQFELAQKHGEAY